MACVSVIAVVICTIRSIKQNSGVSSLRSYLQKQVLSSPGFLGACSIPFDLQLGATQRCSGMRSRSTDARESTRPCSGCQNDHVVPTSYSLGHHRLMCCLEQAWGTGHPQGRPVLLPVWSESWSHVVRDTTGSQCVVGQGDALRPECSRRLGSPPQSSGVPCLLQESAQDTRTVGPLQGPGTQHRLFLTRPLIPSRPHCPS